MSKKEKHNHIFIDKSPEVYPFTSPRAFGVRTRIPDRHPAAHGGKLKGRLQEIWDELKGSTPQSESSSKEGTYLEFKGKAGYDLTTKSLENIAKDIRLLNIRQAKKGEDIETSATVYVPARERDYFTKKIDAYIEKKTRSGKPKNNALISSIEDIRKPSLQALWVDSLGRIPSDFPQWCEAWIRIPKDSQSVPDSFLETLSSLNIDYKTNHLSFPERAVILIHANEDKLKRLIAQNSSLAELRISQEAAGFWVNEGFSDRENRVRDLLSRVVFDKSGVSVCVLDTGINNGHPLIKPFLADENRLTVDPTWDVHDNFRSLDGHGTLMGGIAIYNSLEEALASGKKIAVTHDLCSVKILPNSGQNLKELWGYVIGQAISRAEIKLPENRIVFCLAVTAKDDVDQGRPSSWSGYIDKIAFGHHEQAQEKRLIVVSAGNIRDDNIWKGYPDSNLEKSIENPAQAWNAITVGAYTDKVLISNSDYVEHTPLAPPGGLSPFSSTSACWDSKKWPAKPDVVFEGGNILRAPDQTLIPGYEEYSLLSTAKAPVIKQFGLINATSAATAQAAWMAAKIMQKYPQAWPETVRGLMVHSASWSQKMCSQFKFNLKAKEDVKKMIRIFGYGKPDKDKALYTTSSSLTFVAQEKMQPFFCKETSLESGRNQKKYATKDMHFFKLPWPKKALLDKPDAEVKLRITLSYFIEPGVGEMGWKDKYRYRSHGLCFELNAPMETPDEFKSRINAAARSGDRSDEETGDQNRGKRWMIGMNGRKSGSIHSDIWEGTAGEIATCNMIAIYPIIGWWKQRTHLKKYNTKTRYSLIVSLETPALEIDLYTPVVAKIQNSIAVDSTNQP